MESSQSEGRERGSLVGGRPQEREGRRGSKKDRKRWGYRERVRERGRVRERERERAALLSC